MTKILKINFLFGIILLFSLRQFSWANDTYIKLDYGIPYYDKVSGDYKNNRLKKGQFYGIGVGYKFDNKFRSDITLNKLDNAKFSMNSANSSFQHSFNINSILAMGNIYYDFSNSKKINFYTGVGLGVVQNSVSKYLQKQNIFPSSISQYRILHEKSKKYSLAYGLSVGTSFKLTNSSFIDLGYKYYDLGKIKHLKDKNVPFSKDLESKYRVHFLVLGLEFLFSIRNYLCQVIADS